MVSLGKDEVKGNESRRLCSVEWVGLVVWSPAACCFVGWEAGLRPLDGRGNERCRSGYRRDPCEVGVCDLVYLDWTAVSALKLFKHLIAPR
jgi:hypothetical protein